jgi:hypothetical protein
VLIVFAVLLAIFCRAHPVLKGPPTTMHSGLRQAVSLAARLGAPLSQIVYLHLVNQMTPGQVQNRLKYTGLDNANQAQVRIAWLGHTVGASFPNAVGVASVCGSALVAWIALPACLRLRSFCLPDEHSQSKVR